MINGKLIISSKRPCFKAADIEVNHQGSWSISTINWHVKLLIERVVQASIGNNQRTRRVTEETIKPIICECHICTCQAITGRRFWFLLTDRGRRVPEDKISCIVFDNSTRNMCLVIDVYGTVLCATYGQVYWWVNKVLRKISYTYFYLKLLKTLYCRYILIWC